MTGREASLTVHAGLHSSRDFHDCILAPRM
jgi:hypothetical protein